MQIPGPKVNNKKYNNIFLLYHLKYFIPIWIQISMLNNIATTSCNINVPVFFNVTELFWKLYRYLYRKIMKLIFMYSQCKSLYRLFIRTTNFVEKDNLTSDNLDSQVTCQQTSQIVFYCFLKILENTLTK